MRLLSTTAIVVSIGLSPGCKGLYEKSYDEDPALQCQALKRFFPGPLTKEHVEKFISIGNDPETLWKYLAKLTDAVLRAEAVSSSTPSPRFLQFYSASLVYQSWVKPSPIARVQWAEKLNNQMAQVAKYNGWDPLTFGVREVSGPNMTRILLRKIPPMDGSPIENWRKILEGPSAAAHAPFILGFKEFRVVYPSGKGATVKLTPFGPDMNTFKSDL